MERRFRVYITLTLMILLIAVVSSAVVRMSEKEMASSAEAAQDQQTVAIHTAQYYEDKIPDAPMYCFRTQDLLEQHYEKHGVEMGFASAQEYELAASAVVTDPRALHKTEEEDGDDVYYIEETNEFIVVSTDGYIRTYFLPDAGKAYFDRQ